MPRATNDIDIIVKPVEENFVKLRNALYEVFNDESVADITFSDNEDYQVTRYGTPEGYAIDIMTQPGELYNYYNITFQEIEIEKITVRIADLDSLIKLEENTYRIIDNDDIYFLKELKKKNAGL